LASATEVGDKEEFKTCLSGSTEKMIPAYGEAFIKGASLLKKLKPQEFEKMVIKDYFYENSALAPIQSLKNMKKDNCDIIMGFSTGNDLIAIKDLAERYAIKIISIYGDPSKEISGSKTIITLQPSAQELVKHLMKELGSKLKNSKVVIVTAIDRVEMLEYQEAYKKLIGEVTSNITEFQILEETQNLQELENFSKLGKKFEYLVLLTRSSLAAKISDLLNKTGHSFQILGTKYFGSSELPAFLNYLENKNINAYISRQNCNCANDSHFLRFKEDYIKEYKTTPMGISYEAYIAMQAIESAYKNKKFTAQEITTFLKNHVQGEIGPVIFGRDLSPIRKKNYVIKITKEGYVGI
jgi:hypothetical protein